MRPSDWAPVGFDHDPVPGDPTVVSSAATDYSTIATTLENAATNLRGIAGADECVSEAVAAIMEQAEEVAARLDKAQTRYEGVAAALSIYAVPLSEAQTWSVDALDAAVVARSATNASVEDAEFYEARLREPDLSPELESYYERRRTEVYAELQLHDGALEDAIARLQHAIEHRDSAASTASSSIHDVEESSGLNDTFWDNTVQFIRENETVIDNVVLVIGLVGSIAMLVVLFIPGLNLIALAVLFSIVAVATLVEVANAALQGAAGTKSLVEVVASLVLAVVTFAGVGLAARSAIAATKSTVGLALKMSHVSKGIGVDLGVIEARVLAEGSKAISGTRTLAQHLRTAMVGKHAVQLEAMANVPMISAALATGSHIATTNFKHVVVATEAVNNLFLPLANLIPQVESAFEPSGWRWGDNW
ncbi:hypothetical protein ESZ53_05200 [Salinibacterium sp. UTAS2018]|uniref:hypothetical protein n=1 Tax=Salinibacterium sp. UTAS2018 TaxID=2508880 RepID=UPI0010094B7A|nr:hypothetical protein [Salinibacterium sp. UTAS2018]QAV69884.1 hypothetical protein ESZ53_05200 [Salinibacterium sp. UTAS2018]